MGKHKKFIKSEKAKVKLKGAKLPKGLNITKTEFKVRKIIIREQLKETVTEDGKKKHDVKELLPRLKHHNSSFRTTAMRALAEYLSLQQNEVDRHLRSLIQGIAAVSLDIEKDIRRESFKLLGTIFSMFPPTTIEPFFEILSSYLRCAMTHIQQAIQEDSLLMLDVLLIYVPHLVADNSNRIFSNFLDMISKFRSDEKPGRTLTSNVGNKLTSIKWRTKILERLKEMLATMVEHKQTGKNLSNAKQNDQNLFIPNMPMHFPIHRINLNKSYDLSSVLVRTREQVNDTESSRLKMYISQLVPLLFDSWLEVRSFEKHELKKGEVLISNDAALTLKTVLSILVNLWDLSCLCDEEENDDVVSNWFRKECRKQLNDHIMNAFPYKQTKGSGVAKTKSKGQSTDREVMDSGGPFCVNQNIDLIYLFVLLNARDKTLNADQVSHILQYLIDSIPAFRQYPIDWLAFLPKCLEEILYTNGDYLLRTNEVKTKQLLRAILKGFQGDLLGREQKNRILPVLCEIILNHDLYKAYGFIEFDGWLNELPQMLCKPQVSNNVIATLSQLGKQKSQSFLEALRQSFKMIIENFSVIQILGCDDQFEGKKSLMNLFYWVDTWSQEEKENARQHIQKHVTDKDAISYFLFLLLQS